MKTRAEIDKLFDMYENFSEGYLTSLATDAGKQLVRRISGKRDREYAWDFVTVFCSVLASVDKEPSLKEYNFYLKVTGLSCSYEQFCKMARLNSDHNTLLEMKNYSKTAYFDLSFDLDLLTLGLCMCAIDGNISYAQRNHMITYVPMPGFTDNR